MDLQLTLELRQIGQNLALCIPADFAHAHQLIAGEALTIAIQRAGPNALTAESTIPSLQQMLADFDPRKFGGERFPTPLIGSEVFK